MEISRSKSLWMSWKRQTLEENKHQATAKRYLNALFKMSRPKKKAFLLLIRRESPIIMLSAEFLAHHREVPHIHQWGKLERERQSKVTYR